MQDLTLALSPLPKYWDDIILPPLAIPLQSAKNKNVIDPVTPMAAKASEPTNCPTIIESARLYTC